MDANEIVEHLRGESDRKKTSLYLSQSLVKAFKKACGEAKPSKVMEQLMRDFIDARDKTSKPKSKKVEKKKN